MFPDLDRDGFRSAMRIVERALKQIAVDYKKDTLFRFDGDASAVARKVLPADDSSLQWSPVGAGLASDISLLLDRLFQRLVERYDDKRQMIRSMDEAPRDGSHFLALERVGIEDTDRHVLEWREIWYEPSRAFFGPTMWMSQAGAAQFGEDCFAGWLPLPNKHGAK